MCMWKQDMTTTLIEELHSRPVLWDVTHAHYKNRNKRLDSLKEIADVLNLNVDDINRKIKSLKVQFRREHKSSCANRKRWTSTRRAPWFGYELLQFLLNNTGSINSDPDDNSDKEESDVYEDGDLTQVHRNSSEVSKRAAVMASNPNTPVINLSRTNPPNYSKKIRLEQGDETFTTTREIRSDSSNRDEFTVYGELVANKLRKFSISPVSVAVAQRSINDILFNLEMEHYAEDTSPKAEFSACHAHGAGTSNTSTF